MAISGQPRGGGADSPAALADPAEARLLELQRIGTTMSWIRAGAVPFAIVQVLTYYLPYPPGTQAVAWAGVALLAVGAPLVHLGLRRSGTPVVATRWSLAGLLLDGTAAMALVAAYTFDPNTAVWALLYMVVLEGALLFQLRGALGTVAALTVAYTLREVYGAVVWDVPFLLVSITFRMGLGVMMAAAFGVTAERLVHERDRLRETSVALAAARQAQLDFVAVTNHELRTPLTAIKGFARTLRHRWAELDDDSRLAAVERIDTQSRRLGELIEDVLTVSSMRAGPPALAPRPLVLREWLEEALHIADVPGTVACAPSTVVRLDPNRLLQILVNLLTNARKYGEPPVEVSALVVGDRVRIAVRDHGPGVAPDFADRMFEEFTQASVGPSRTADGNGLGLAIVRYLAGALGGSVRYRTHPEGGAVFEVDLPVGGRTAEGALHPDGRLSAADGGAAAALTRATPRVDVGAHEA